MCKKIDAELDITPEIIVYGKLCHQQRNVGFYSDTSIGYNYSTTTTPSKNVSIFKRITYLCQY